MSALTLGRGGGGFGGGGRGGFGGRSSTGGRSTGGRSTTRSPFGRPGRTGSRVGSGRSTIVHNHVVVNNRSYSIRSGGWGYGYYGHNSIVIEHWYGYPVFYGNPGHWSGWDWFWFPFGIAVVLLILAALWAVVTDA